MATTADQTRASLHRELQRALLGRRLGRVFLYTALFVIVILFFMLPLLWLVVSSLKANSEVLAYPPIVFPRRLVFENYKTILVTNVLRRTGTTFFASMVRSLWLICISSIPLVFSCSFVGFGFARHRAPGRDVLFTVMLSMMLVPGMTIAIPQYVLYAKLHMVYTYWPWFLGSLAGSPIFIFLFRQFYMNFSKELEDAASIDGCDRLRMYWQIFLPNSTPIVATVLLMSSLGTWGDYFFPALYLRDDQSPLAMLLASASCDPNVTNQCINLVTPTLAGVVVWALPMVVIYVLGQRYFTNITLTSGIK